MKACVNDVIGWNMQATGTETGGVLDDIRVRIGTTDTIGDERLHVDGNIKATGNISANVDTNSRSYFGRACIGGGGLCRHWT
jgi:hypothetical protein